VFRRSSRVPPSQEPVEGAPRHTGGLPTWFIVETMFATMTIGSLLLDLRRKSRVIDRTRRQLRAVEGTP
jgi:hypothetical protein